MRLIGKLPAILFTVLLLLTAALEGVNFILQHEDNYKIRATFTEEINQHIPGAKINFSAAKLQLGWKRASIRVADLHLSGGGSTLTAPQADFWIQPDGVVVVLSSPDITLERANAAAPPPLVAGKHWAVAATDAVIRWRDKETGVSLTLQHADLQMRFDGGVLAAEVYSRTQAQLLHARTRLTFERGIQGTVHAVLGGWRAPSGAAFHWRDMGITARIHIDNRRVQLAAAGKLQQPYHSRLPVTVAAVGWQAQGDFTIGGAATMTMAVVATTLQFADFGDAPPADTESRGVFTYHSDDNTWQWRGDETTAASTDGALTARLEMRGRGAVVEYINAAGRLVNVPADSLWRYINYPKARTWFVKSLREGIIENAHVRVRADFLPTMVLRTTVTAVFSGGRIEIGGGWPAATRLNGVLVVHDDTINIVGEGMMAGVSADNVVARIPNVTAARTTLYMNARFARTLLSDYLLATRQLPPLAKAVEKHTEGLNLSADAWLLLTLTTPLSMPQDSTFASRVHVQNGRLSVAKLPPLQNLAGIVRVDNGGGQVALAGDLEGNAITLHADAGRVLLRGRVAAKTALSVAGLDEFWAYGEGDFALSIVAGRTVFVSDLRGVGIDLPPPFGKPPLLTAHLSVRTSAADGRHMALQFDGNIFRAVAVGDGIDVAINDNSQPPPPLGVRFHGGVNYARTNPNNDDDTPSTGLGVAGTLFYRPGEVRANLQHFTITDLSATTKVDFDMQDLTVNIAVEQLQLGEVKLGALTLSGSPFAGGWRLNRMVLSDNANTLSVSGRYNGVQTALTLRMNAPAVPAVLQQFGVGGVISEGVLTATGEVYWPQTPVDFSLAGLGGRLSLRADGLRYLKKSSNNVINLLAIFSPQSLLSLGFTEIGKEGIYLDSLTGEIILADGRIIFENVEMKNEDLGISLQGDTDWKTKQLNINGRVRPGHKLLKASSVMTLGVGVAAITPVSLAAGWFLGKIFEKPLSEIGAYNYAITGDWQTPIYTETGITFKPPPPLEQQSPAP